MLTNVGKNVISTTIAIFDPCSTPNHTIARGASAMIGTDAEATAYGSTSPANAGDWLATMAARIPPPQPSA